jgi:hypothetical protein
MAAEVGGCGTNMPHAANCLFFFPVSGYNNPDSAFSLHFTRRRWLELGVTATFLPHMASSRPLSYDILKAAYTFFLPPSMYFLLHTCVFLPRAAFVEKFLGDKL